MYRRYIKRILDFIFSLCAIIILFPVMVILTIIGIVAMRGNPFFVQERPGKNERIFKLYKFRSMNYKKDINGNLLPDDLRLTRYGKFLRNSSLDELPQLFNIIKGDMSFVGPRPLLVEYLTRYTAEQLQRHDVRPGLTGYAQVHGRTSICWEDRFKMDIAYVQNITFLNDAKIIMRTVKTVIAQAWLHTNEPSMTEKFMGGPR